MNSVKEIVTECQRLISICDGIEERTDVFCALTGLGYSLSILNKEFMKEHYDEFKITELKNKCERDAIYLEYILSIFNKDLRKRYIDRLEIATLFETIDSIVRKDFKKTHYANKEFINNTLCNYASINKLLHKSQHIIFNLSEDERELIRIIGEQVKAYSLKV